VREIVGGTDKPLERRDRDDSPMRVVTDVIVPPAANTRVPSGESASA
jgi:hypothetical protein